jgi:hypothetical protein
MSSNNHNHQAAQSASSQPPPSPIPIHYALGNTYALLPIHSAPLDYTKRHRKVHDWILYVDILPGSDPDLVDRVTFDMRDDSFRGLSFTSHCPIRIRDASSSTANEGQSMASRGPGEGTEENKAPSTNPRPRHSSRQQTYGAVDVRITLRGVGGSKSVVDYKVLLRENAPETLGVFVERRPKSCLRPIKMTDGNFAVRLDYGIDTRDEELPLQNGAENRMLLQQIAKSIYSRSKRPMRAVLHNPSNGESWTEEWFGCNSKKEGSVAWTLSFAPPSKVDAVKSANQTQLLATQNATLQPSSSVISISSPSLVGGEGLNECYKVIEGLPTYLTCTNENQIISYSQQDHSLHVQIDVSNLTLLQIIKVCQNFVKYEEAMDSFMPWHRRDDCCSDCRGNKLAMRGDETNPQQQQLNNKDRNNQIAKCTSFRDLISCLNPQEGQHYKLNLRNLIPTAASSNNNNNISIEFRQHPTSKDKTTTTHWIRFCMAFVKNSARLRSPNALKNTTSIEDEFDLLFEYVVKDRALRNFYRERRDEYAAKEEEERLERLVANQGIGLGGDDMSISEGGSDDETLLGDDANDGSNLKRASNSEERMDKSKRHCS